MGWSAERYCIDSNMASSKIQVSDCRKMVSDHYQDFCFKYMLKGRCVRGISIIPPIQLFLISGDVRVSVPG